MVLTPEDEANPELLAELTALLPETTAVAESPKIVSVDELKKEIVALKRQGDIEGAKAKLKELMQLEHENKPQVKPPSPTAAVEQKSELLNIEQPRPKKSQSTSPSANPKDTQVYRDLFAKLQRQSASCQSIGEFYSSCNRKSDANLFYKRKQAFDLELQKLRLQLKSKQPAPIHRTVNVTFEHVSVNPEVPEGELQLSLGNLHVILPRKFKLKATEEYRLKLVFDLFGLTEAETTLLSGPFTTQGLSKSKGYFSFLLY